MTAAALTLGDLVAALDPLDPPAQWQTLRQLAETGAAAILAPARGNWDADTWTIRALGAEATGTSQAEVLRNWMRVAMTMACGTPPGRDTAAWAAATIHAPRSMATDLSEACTIVHRDPDSFDDATRVKAAGFAIALARHEARQQAAPTP